MKSAFKKWVEDIKTDAEKTVVFYYCVQSSFFCISLQVLTVRVNFSDNFTFFRTTHENIHLESPDL